MSANNLFLRLLKKVFNHELRFPDGSTIDFSGPESLLCVQADRKMMDICWYWQKGGIRAREIRRIDIDKWRSPHNGEKLSDEKREEILEKIREFSKKHRIALQEIS